MVPKDVAAFDPRQLFAVPPATGRMVPGFIQVLAQSPKTASEKPQDRFLMEIFERTGERASTPDAGG